MACLKAGRRYAGQQPSVLVRDAHVIPMITGATILCFSFTGFDGISNLSEETKDAERVIPRAIFLTALIGG